MFVLVAELAGTVIGYAWAGIEGYDNMSLRGPAGVLYDIVVDPAHRGQGIGQRLLDSALATLAQRDTRRVVLSTAARNESAQRLFVRAAFRHTTMEMTRECGNRQAPPAHQRAGLHDDVCGPSSSARPIRIPSGPRM